MIHAPHTGPIKQQGSALQNINQMTCDLCLINGFLLTEVKFKFHDPQGLGDLPLLSPKLTFPTSSLCTSHLAFTLFFFLSLECAKHLPSQALYLFSPFLRPFLLDICMISSFLSYFSAQTSLPQRGLL